MSFARLVRATVMLAAAGCWAAAAWKAPAARPASSACRRVGGAPLEIEVHAALGRCAVGGRQATRASLVLAAAALDDTEARSALMATRRVPGESDRWQTRRTGQSAATNNERRKDKIAWTRVPASRSPQEAGPSEVLQIRAAQGSRHSTLESLVLPRQPSRAEAACAPRCRPVWRPAAAAAGRRCPDAQPLARH